MLKGLVLFKLDDAGKKVYMENWKNHGYGKGGEIVSVTYTKNDAGVFLEGTKKQLKELLQKLNVDTKIWETEETML
ncbi:MULTISPECIES: hypothetical protein [Listeria]|uniref:Uncharacterized protein n=1 Tax=Listeria seeligeri TaxID=1640 RepID=A0A7X0X494_LISSE|nr:MULTISPECIES: hypothetical protein [Listeria]EAE3734165.1 hypothetical protein [Listeria monocytogenes]EAE3749712.1 hypothetical protein [Listeria monocytogenes]EAE5773703.1 hypothetical protein [Listeria monocytogenes]EAE6178246.1 hypothetical protein [Listeria monocytogenes]EAE6181307.1 hypothetical protein [Listeria monocytogenes]